VKLFGVLFVSLSLIVHAAQAQSVSPITQDYPEAEILAEIGRIQQKMCSLLERGDSINQVILNTKRDVEKLYPGFILEYITYLRKTYGETGQDIFEITTRRMLGGAIKRDCAQHFGQLSSYYQNYQSQP
jgi:hypothetical protein